MPPTKNDYFPVDGADPREVLAASQGEGATDTRRQDTLLIAGALQSAIFNSANFSSIATDAKGVIQIFNVGAERMLGFTAAEVLNKITPADISDPSEVIARAEALSIELDTPITPGFEVGYEMAMSTIVDANVTHLVAAMVMFNLGEGPVRGFALTLAIGVLTSIFTAVVVARWIMAVWLKTFRPKWIPI